jgi:hypothetical protein
MASDELTHQWNIWDDRRTKAHLACPCICQLKGGVSCLQASGAVDACWNCQQFHTEVDEITEENKKHGNAKG